MSSSEVTVRLIRSSVLVNQSEVGMAYITQLAVSNDGAILYALGQNMVSKILCQAGQLNLA